VVVQSAQTEPAAPHEKSELAWHTPLKQQPLGQLVESQPLQVAPVQVLPVGQCWHWAPPVPHVRVSLPFQHTPASSQQPAQLAAPQPVDPAPPPAASPPPAPSPPP
jgi:hypothetical protein